MPAPGIQELCGTHRGHPPATCSVLPAASPALPRPAGRRNPRGGRNPGYKSVLPSGPRGSCWQRRRLPWESAMLAGHSRRLLRYLLLLALTWGASFFHSPAQALQRYQPRVRTVTCWLLLSRLVSQRSGWCRGPRSSPPAAPAAAPLPRTLLETPLLLFSSSAPAQLTFLASLPPLPLSTAGFDSSSASQITHEAKATRFGAEPPSLNAASGHPAPPQPGAGGGFLLQQPPPGSPLFIPAPRVPHPCGWGWKGTKGGCLAAAPEHRELLPPRATRLDLPAQGSRELVGGLRWVPPTAPSPLVCPQDRAAEDAVHPADAAGDGGEGGGRLPRAAAGQAQRGGRPPKRDGSHPPHQLPGCEALPK